MNRHHATTISCCYIPPACARPTFFRPIIPRRLPGYHRSKKIFLSLFFRCWKSFCQRDSNSLLHYQTAWHLNTQFKQEKQKNYERVFYVENTILCGQVNQIWVIITPVDETLGLQQAPLVASGRGFLLVCFVFFYRFSQHFLPVFLLHSTRPFELNWRMSLS